MPGELVAWGLFLGLLIWVLAKAGRRRGGRAFNPGPGAVGSVYDLLNEDKRKAIELIVEEKAEARDPETADDKPTAGL